VAVLPQMNGALQHCGVQEQPAGQEGEEQKRRNITQLPLLIPTLPESQQMPLEQLALQHSLEKKQESPVGLHAAHLPLLLSQLALQHSRDEKQESPFGTHAGAHLPLLLSQLSIQHSLSALQDWPTGVHTQVPPRSSHMPVQH
jgi:hypothetical protein